MHKATCGRIVHFIPNFDDETYGEILLLDLRGRTKVPAVVQDDDTCPDLNIFTGDNENPVVVMISIPHKSEYKSGAGWWEWPQRDDVSDTQKNIVINNCLTPSNS